MELKRFFNESKATEELESGREIEWRRTLGCKMFEEKMSSNSGGNGEEMDLLWEIIHEADNKKKTMKMEMEVYCNLQQAGKTNLGMKKTSLVKISNAIKGIGWLHHLTSHNK